MAECLGLSVGISLSRFPMFASRPSFQLLLNVPYINKGERTLKCKKKQEKYKMNSNYFYLCQKKFQKIHLPAIEPGSIITKYHTQGRLVGLLYSVDFHRAWNRRYGSSFEPFRQGVPRAHPDSSIGFSCVYIQTVVLSWNIALISLYRQLAFSLLFLAFHFFFITWLVYCA